MDGASEPGQTVFQNTGLITAQPVEHVTKPRAKGVGRRELQRKAEACVTRSVVTPSASIPIRSTPTPSLNQTMQAVLPRPSPTVAGSFGTGSGSGNGAIDNDNGGHEYADDDSGSELSELEDEPEEPTPVLPTRTTMFPGLMNNKEREVDESGASAAPTPSPTPAEDGDGDVKMEE